MKKEGPGTKESSLSHPHMANDRYTLTFAFAAGRVASLTRPCALLHIVMVWAGAMTLSLGAEQKEKHIAGQAVGGPRAPTRLAALAAFLTASRGDFGVISETKRGGKD